MSDTDLLGEPYTSETIALRPDAEGDVVATLVHRPSPLQTGRAVLHVHGFADYFFQTAAADFWCERGYDFYALDLRKYGRSLRSHQTPNYTSDLREYYEELDVALRRVREDHDHIVVSAHSTGGLTASLWLHDHRPDVRALFLNSPWLDMQGSLVVRRAAMPVITRVGRAQPDRLVPRKVSGVYARSLHREYDGEWDFDTAWKPIESWPVYAGWLRAIRQGQARLARGLDLRLPVLVLTSNASSDPDTNDDPSAATTDTVIDVDQVRRRAPMIGRHLTLVRLEGALHDVTLSATPVREAAFDELARFLSAYVDR